MKCIYIDSRLNRCNIESDKVFCNCHSNYNNKCSTYVYFLLDVMANKLSIKKDKYLIAIHIYNFINLTNIYEFDYNLAKYDELTIIMVKKIFEISLDFPSFIIWLDILNSYKNIPEEKKNFKSEYLELYKKLLDCHKEGNIIEYNNVLSKMKNIDESTNYYISDSPTDNFYKFPIITKINNNCFIDTILKSSEKYPFVVILFDILQINYEGDNKYYNLYKKLKMYSELNCFVKYKSILNRLIDIDKYTLDLINGSFTYLPEINIIFKYYLESINSYKFPKQPIISLSLLK